jgi:hypothetical protein
MRKAFRALAYLLVAEVVVQAMMIGIALAGVNRWIDDGHTITKEVVDSHPRFAGSVGFPIHAINGEMLIPLLVLSLLVVSFFAAVPAGTRRAAILVGLVVLQVILGMVLQNVPYVALLHVLNAFAILAVALITARSVPTGPRTASDADSAPAAAGVPSQSSSPAEPRTSGRLPRANA